MNDAGAALAGVATDMGAGQPQRFAQQLHQEGAPLNRSRNRLAVDGKAHRLLHENLPELRSSQRPTLLMRASFLRRRRWVKAPAMSQNSLYTVSYDAAAPSAGGVITPRKR